MSPGCTLPGPDRPSFPFVWHGHVSVLAVGRQMMKKNPATLLGSRGWIQPSKNRDPSAQQKP
jgi:hypothetical protein